MSETASRLVEGLAELEFAGDRKITRQPRRTAIVAFSAEEVRSALHPGDVHFAPTTLLARQHYKTFVERYQGFPLNIGRLSRLVPPKEATQTRDGITDGTLDIVIGTHAVLAKSIEIKRLGLVIGPFGEVAPMVPHYVEVKGVVHATPVSSLPRNSTTSRPPRSRPGDSLRI